jgi:hypothetical protein
MLSSVPAVTERRRLAGGLLIFHKLVHFFQIVSQDIFCLVSLLTCFLLLLHRIRDGVHTSLIDLPFSNKAIQLLPFDYDFTRYRSLRSSCTGFSIHYYVREWVYFS